MARRDSAEWYKLLVPKAQDEQDTIAIFSKRTRVGRLTIITPIETFRISQMREDRVFGLALNGHPGMKVFGDACDAVVAASKHRSGIPKLDGSTEAVSDYIRDWRVCVKPHFLFNYIDLWLRGNPRGSLRDLVDYFEHDPTHLVDRLLICRALKEMIVTGQLKKLPSDHLTPAELHGILTLAREYGVCIPGNRY